MLGNMPFIPNNLKKNLFSFLCYWEDFVGLFFFFSYPSLSFPLLLSSKSTVLFFKPTKKRVDEYFDHRYVSLLSRENIGLSLLSLEYVFLYIHFVGSHNHCFVNFGVFW